MEPSMIGILRQTGFQITDSRSQTLYFGWGYTELVCMRACVGLIKVKSKRKFMEKNWEKS